MEWDCVLSVEGTTVVSPPQDPRPRKVKPVKLANQEAVSAAVVASSRLQLQHLRLHRASVS